MPARKKPSSLQSLSLRRIGLLFKATCQRVSEELLANLIQQYQHLSYVQLKTLKTSFLCDPIAQIQKCFFVDTAYFFQEQIVIECLVGSRNIYLFYEHFLISGSKNLQVALSELLDKSDGNREISAFMSRNIDQKKLLTPLFGKKEIYLEFLDVFCSPGARIKTLDISINVNLSIYRPIHAA